MPELTLTHQQVQHFRTFGFLVLRGLLDADEVARLTAEASESLRAAYGATRRRDDDPEYLPLTVDRTPFSQSLVADDPRLFQGSTALLGTPTVPSAPEAICFTHNFGWHTDIGRPDIAGVTFLAHLEPRAADDGALRVVPGSHDAGFARRIGGYLAQDPACQGYEGWPVPATVLETEPGDVLAFDVHLRHSSVGGERRLAWRTEYLEWPGLGEPERMRAVRDLITDAAEHTDLGFDTTTWPAWKEWAAGAAASPARQVAVERLRLLGVPLDDLSG